MKPKHLLFAMLALFASINVLAYDVEIDGINYNFIPATDNEVEVTGRAEGQEPYSGSVVIPESVTWDNMTYSVTRIGDGAFYACRSLTSINIPNGVTSIGGNAFIDTRLTSVTIPESVTSIGGAAFSVQPNLISISVDEDNPIYDSRDNCNAIIETATNTLISGCNNTVIPNSVTSIGRFAFYGSGLTSIIIPGNVTSIEESAFAYCDELTSLTLSEGVKNIGQAAFYHSVSLESIFIPKSMELFDGNPFGPHPSLISISVVEGNQFFDSRGDCNALINTETNTLTIGCKNTIIPNDVECIGEGAFDGCSNLTSITIPDNVTSIGYCAFVSCDNLSSVTIGSGVTNISREAFRDCSSLTSITIPDNVTGIGFSAFSYCSSLNAITIGSGITGIDECAFHDCNSLTDVYCYAEVLPTIYNWIENNEIGTNAFGDTPIGSATLHVPAASLQAYSTTAPWSNFGTIVAIEEDQNIAFADTNVKAICVGAITNWDTNGDGELSESEAAAVTDLGEVFRNKNEITTFNELQYFTGLTNISNYAFYNCSNLTSIIIPNNVTSIGNFSFHGCNNLSSITIHDGITSLGNNVFEECFSLPSITIPNSVSSIGGNAFTSTHMTSIVVEEGNTTYDSRDNCNAIIESETNKIISGCKNTTIPSTVTSIGREAFSGRDITTITIPNSITSVDYAAFFCCTSLTDVWCYAENIPITGDRLFTNTPIGEATLHVPAASLQAYSTTAPWSGFGTIVAIDNTPIIAFADANVKAICVGATTNWDTNGDGELSEAEAAAVTDLGTVFKENNEITSFNELQYFTGLTSISNNAFQGCSSLTFITIPSSISRIGTYAFSDCVSLTSVTLPNSVTSIGGYAFYNCLNLKSVMMPASIITFEGYLAFGENNNIESVYISDLTSWLGTSFSMGNNPLRSGAKLYLNNVEVKDLVIPDGTTSILTAAFEGCESLTSVTIPSCVTSIDGWAFASNINLATVTIAESVTSIGDCAFKGCSRLTSINIPNGVTSINYEIFADCQALPSITIPNNVTNIGNFAFKGCSTLSSIVIPESMTSIGEHAFQNCYELTSANLPSGITTINPYLFCGCGKLESIVIPNSVTSIGDLAFCECWNLTSFTIPESVTTIGEYAFFACGLTDFYCYAEEAPNTESNAFDHSPITSATLHVPAASLQAYSTTAPWSGFGTKVAIEGAGEEMLYAEDATVNRGATFELPIHMDNGDEEITAFSFDVEVPAGVTILSATLSERKADQTNPVPTLKSDGSYGLATLSVSNANFSGSEGTLLTLTVKVNANVTPGNYTIKLKNIELSTISNPIELPDCTSTLTVLDVMTGDVNGDGKVSIFDAVQIINYILENDPDPFIFSAADLDGNGKITIFDAVSVVNIILTQSSSNNVKEMQFIDELDPQ